jgi:hypothetical protein
MKHSWCFRRPRAARPPRQLGRAWALPLVGAAGILVTITLDVDPIHDIGLFVFEGAWVALGVALLRAEHRPRPETASASGLTARTLAYA